MKLEQLRGQIQIEGFSKKQIYANDKFETVLAAVKEGTEIPAHPTPADAGIYVLEGHLIFDNEGNATEVKTDDFLTVKKGQMHSLKAVKDSKIMISRAIG